MKVAGGIVLAGVLMVATLSQAAITVTHFSSELDTKTGWTETQGGPNGYSAAGDPWGKEGGDGAHSSITTATSERQAVTDSPVDIAAPGFVNLTYSTRLMLHNSKAGVNEAVGRAGMLTAGGGFAEGKLHQFWITLRRVGALELAVRRWTDDVGNAEYIVNTYAFVDTVGQGLSGYNYADFTVTRDSGGLWTVDAQNPYGETAVHFTAQESTVATSSALNTVYMQDLPNQYSGGETAIYYDNVSVTSEVPEPATLSLLAIGCVAMLRRRR